MPTLSWEFPFIKMSLKGCSRFACELSICTIRLLLHRLLVLINFSLFLPVYCIFRCYILLLHHSFHAPFSHHFRSSSCFFLSSDEQINIRLGHLLSPMHNRFPYRFNMLFSILFRTVCYSHLFLITLFLTLKFWMFLKLCSKR